jgi:hypothetical protein
MIIGHVFAALLVFGGTATARARNAGSFLDWMETMQGLVTSFRDGHTGIAITVLPTSLRWPGFLIDGQGGHWVVRRPSTAPTAADTEPPEGAELVGCDGQPAERFLEQQLDQKTVDWSKAPLPICSHAWRSGAALESELLAKQPLLRSGQNEVYGESVGPFDLPVGTRLVPHSRLDHPAAAQLTRRSCAGHRVAWSDGRRPGAAQVDCRARAKLTGDDIAGTLIRPRRPRPCAQP